MKTIILSIEDIRLIVQYVGLDSLMDEMIDRLTSALQEFSEKNTVIPPRDGFQYSLPNIGLLEWMPIMKVGGTATMKIVGYHPSNPSLRDLPTILSTISAYDTASGHLLCMADGTFLTALRTGAASAVASRIMAAPQTQVVGLIGCGAQAITQLHAISRIFEIEKVLVYDIDPAVRHSFLSRTSFMNLDIIEVDRSSLDLLVRSTDIICTCTSVGMGEGPVFEDIGTQPWVHINAIGSDFPRKKELPTSLLERSFVCPDFLEQAIKEGECQYLSPEAIGPSLVELVQHQEKYDFVKQETSVFDSTGWAFEDGAAMEMLMSYAAELGLGISTQIESISDDPRNPYHLITDGNYSTHIGAAPAAPIDFQNGLKRN
ncbi:MAG: ornithine cyclodeaminase family protein [Candidatus Poribacteria bacterium]|nr:ornithine cyclodeaminase family protein [Candidatus Poribacteria bacterium]